jgi:hypothetical protein
VRAMTSVSAVIFLAGPDYMLSTVYIVNRAESGDYGGRGHGTRKAVDNENLLRRAR